MRCSTPSGSEELLCIVMARDTHLARTCDATKLHTLKPQTICTMSVSLIQIKVDCSNSRAGIGALKTNAWIAIVMLAVISRTLTSVHKG